MAIAVDQASLFAPAQATGSSTTIAGTTNVVVASGATIFVAVAAGDTSVTVADNSGNGYTYTQIATVLDANNLRIWLFRAYATNGLASGTVITATFGAAQIDRMLGASSFTGIASSSPEDVAATTRDSTGETSWNSASITTLNADDVVIGLARTSGAGSPTDVPGSPFLELLDWTLSGAQSSVTLIYRIVSATGTYTPNGVWSTSQTGGSEEYITTALKAAAVAVQSLGPSADSVDGNWLNEADSNVNLFASVDEDPSSDADYIKGPLGGVNDATRLKLETGTDPAVSTGHDLKWRISKNFTGGAQINATIKIYQGGGNSLGAGTLIKTATRTNVDAWTTYTETLSGGEADAITNYADLYVEIWETQV